MRHPTRSAPFRFPASLAILAALLTLLIAIPRARAQGESPGDLRRENDRLRNRVAQLEARNQTLEEDSESLRKRLAQIQAQLARLQSDVPALREENAALKQQLRDHNIEPRSAGSPGAAPGGPASTPGASDLPDDPLACPPCLLEALRSSYAERFGSRDVESDRAGYLRDVRRWTGEMRRKFRDTVAWTVEIDPNDVPGDVGLPVKLRVVDPGSHEPYHTRTVAVDLDRRHTRRIMAEPDTRYWLIEGVFYANPDVNVDRVEEGPIPFPPFIGPFAEFDFRFSARSVAPAGS